MRRKRVSFKAKDRFKRSVRGFINDLGRKVLVHKTPIKSECPNCFYDKLTDSSTGRCKWSVTVANQRQDEYELGGGVDLRYKYFRVGRCPVCRGQGYLETSRTVWISCSIAWEPSEDSSNNITYTPAGSEGSTAVRLKTDPKYYNVFKNCQKIIVEGVECKLSKPPIMRGIGSQTVLIVIAFTTEKPSVDSGEIIKDY